VHPLRLLEFIDVSMQQGPTLCFRNRSDTQDYRIDFSGLPTQSLTTREDVDCPTPIPRILKITLNQFAARLFLQYCEQMRKGEYLGNFDLMLLPEVAAPG
jgi:hypothetical protein